MKIESELNIYRNKRKVSIIFYYSATNNNNSKAFSFKLGDLIIITNDALPAGIKNPDDWLCGITERTGERGAFPIENVYVLPTVTRPSDDYLVCIEKSKKCLQGPYVSFEKV